jgi:hypothetical protein
VEEEEDEEDEEKEEEEEVDNRVHCTPRQVAAGRSIAAARTYSRPHLK